MHSQGCHACLNIKQWPCRMLRVLFRIHFILVLPPKETAAKTRKGLQLDPSPWATAQIFVLAPGKGRVGAGTTPGAGGRQAGGRQEGSLHWQDLLRHPATARDVVGHQSLRGLGCGVLPVGREVGVRWVGELPRSHRPRPGEAQGGRCDRPLRPRAAVPALKEATLSRAAAKASSCPPCMRASGSVTAPVLVMPYDPPRRGFGWK